jgi:hypothetical protein
MKRVFLRAASIYRRARAAWFVSLLCLLLSLFVAGCPAPDKKAPAAEKPAGIDREFSSGPLTFHVMTDKSEITIAERLTLTLVAEVDKSCHVTLPEAGAKIDEFSIKDFAKDNPVLVDGGKMKYRETFLLEPFLSGDYSIPAFTVKFHGEGESADDPHVLESEPITIKVNSLLDEDVKKLEVADIIGPVVPPPPDLRRFFIIVGIVLVVGAVATVLVLRYLKKRAEKTRIVTIPAHELAYRELRKLVTDDLIGKGEYRFFYFRISDILRHYIENRFELRAPELTTEEFLAELAKRPVLGEEQDRILRSFLAHCDLVKFARHEPANEEIQRTFDAVKNFIGATESAEARIEDSRPADEAIIVEGL